MACPLTKLCGPPRPTPRSRRSRPAQMVRRIIGDDAIDFDLPAREVDTPIDRSSNMHEHEAWPDRSAKLATLKGRMQ